MIKSGDMFGNLMAVEPFGIDGRHQLWKCICVCFNYAVVRESNLRRGHTKSCGCRKTHGEAGKERTAEYRAWRGMINRCYNSNMGNFPRYGGRGITVCTVWRFSYAAFLSHVGRKPHWSMSLDRYPNRDGNYEPGNVRWATAKQQANNRKKRDIKAGGAQALNWGSLDK